MTLDAQLVIHSVPDEELALPARASDQEPPPPDSLLLFVDPSQALEAARRMEANCRTGLRFFSDFRRVRPLDSFQLDDDGEALETTEEAFDFEVADGQLNVRFNPAFSRR